MCGIVGAAARREVAGILIEGLRRLEYRGYDSAGLAVIDESGHINKHKRVGKVAVVGEANAQEPLQGHTGISHTRWATHGKPTEANAHPHLSNNKIAVVHNGIIENHEELRAKLRGLGYEFLSQTDTETIVHLIHHEMRDGKSVLEALKVAIPQLHGAYGVAIINADDPERIVCARSGSPLVLGLGIGENFLASDQLALRQVTDRFVYLEEGDIAEITPDSYKIWDKNGTPQTRKNVQMTDAFDTADKGAFRHFMLKEIFEQPKVISNTLLGRLGSDHILEEAFGIDAKAILDKVQAVQIVACGTSYHAGLVAKYWIEGVAGVPCRVEVASEFRYRKFVVRPDTLFVTISQSGETADTLAALRLAKESGYAAALAVCNVATSSLVRESDLALMTQAGPEIGVASTKAFTTQLVALLLLTIALGRRHALSKPDEANIVKALHHLSDRVKDALALNDSIEKLAEKFVEKNHALFLGRGILWPIAMEGALKLKEISYIHAEGYPAGEMKHGPIALIDEELPVVTIAPHDAVFE
ncbi:MAG: glutamine--fructose-6-phosphate transaminase (isomerizing), partial [Spongiibacteraceae bacterium]